MQQRAAELATLKDLRHAVARTQEELATVLGVGQDTISRLEQRSDILLSTLKRYVEAMGGKLDLVATFPNRPQWKQVDLTRQLAWIHPDQAKARKAIAVPLNADAMVLVQKQVGKQQTYVFSFRGQPVVQLSTKAWYAALERAGIADFRWHDLRHT